jgi:hypothetical protein
LVPTPDGRDDVVRIGGPGEGSWVGVVLGEEMVESDLEVDEGVEDPHLSAHLASLTKSVEPRA